MHRAAPFVLVLLTSCAGLTINDLPQRDYVALGDSVTAGVGAGGEGVDPECLDVLPPSCDLGEAVDRRQAYPYLVAGGLGMKHANVAVPGAMADDVARLQVVPALALRPRIVTLFVGGNDLVHGRSPEAYAADVAFILGRLTESPDVRVYVLNLPDVWRAPRFVEKPDRDVTPERVKAFNAATASAAATYGATLIDISGPELTEHTSTDGFHLGPRAHGIIAARILEARR